jgi:hypothetical protein
VRSDVRALLDDLVADQPDPAVGLDRLIARGRRRTRMRAAAVGTVGLTVAVGLIAGVLALRPGQTPGNLPPLEQPSASQAASTGRPPGSTEKSRELASQLDRLAPEIDHIPGAQRSDAEDFAADGSPERHLSAESIWTYPVANGQNMVNISVEVGTAHGVPPVCDGMTPGINKCTEVRRLPGGSTAYIHNYTAAGGHQYEVRLMRPDGTWVYVGSGAQMPPGSSHDAALPADRVLEIAQGITVGP